MGQHADPIATGYTRPERPYVPHDVIDETGKTAIMGLGSGIFVAAIHNALSRRNVGALSVFTRGAPIIGLASKSTTGPRSLAIAGGRCVPFEPRKFGMLTCHCVSCCPCCLHLFLPNQHELAREG